jgi:hypothetical protein
MVAERSMSIEFLLNVFGRQKPMYWAINKSTPLPLRPLEMRAGLDWNGIRAYTV